MRSTFLIEVLVCPRCGGRRRLLAAIQDPESIREVLGEPTMTCRKGRRVVVMGWFARIRPAPLGGGDGAPAMLVRANLNATAFLGSVLLHAGRSGTFFVGEAAARLVLLRGDEIVRRIPIQPDPGRTTQVQ